MECSEVVSVPSDLVMRAKADSLQLASCLGAKKDCSATGMFGSKPAAY